MKKLVIVLIAVILLLVSAACSQAKERGSETYPAPAPVPGAPPPPSITLTVPPNVPRPTVTTASTTVPGPVPAPTPAPVPTSAPSTSYNDAERMIVRTGQMALVVVDIPATIEQITRIAEQHQGYVVSSRSWREGERLRGTISIRVAASDFETVVRSVGQLAAEVTSLTTSSKDVTEEYVDLTAKLKNLEATEEQLLRIMEKAQKVDEILSVQRELTRTREEIERTKGRMQYLERTSSTSIIDISLEQAKLEVKFSANQVGVKAGEKVWFKGEISGGFGPYSYEWDFGDGATSTNPAPSHQYKSPGSYTVTLKVTDDRRNTDTETRKDYITALPGWSAGQVASSASNGLVVLGRVLASIFIWLGYLSPVWIIGGGIVLYLRYRRKKRA